MSWKVSELSDSAKRKLPAEFRKAQGKAGMTMEEILAKNEVVAEAKLHTLSKQLLAHHGVTIIGEAAMRKRSTYNEGWPDLVFCLHTWACAIELKVGSNQLDEHQIKCRDAMIADGWHHATCWTLQEVSQTLRGWEESARTKDTLPHHD